ncbi:MAG: helix-turn-helix domain-containing protein, partial [Dehalococcoidia bacterium]
MEPQRPGTDDEPRRPAEETSAVAARPPWDAAAVRQLRGHLRLSQAGLAERLGTRQQTVSEWETGARAPRRMSRRLLHMLAESEGFYTTAADEPP